MKSKEPKKFQIVVRYTTEFVASVKYYPKATATGETLDIALGRLVQKHSDLLGIVLDKRGIAR